MQPEWEFMGQKPGVKVYCYFQSYYSYNCSKTTNTDVYLHMYHYSDCTVTYIAKIVQI